MDHKFTEQLKAYLDQPEPERDIEEGATLLLRLDRNKNRYNTFLRYRNVAIYRRSLFAALQRHLVIRLEGYTISEVARMDPKATEATKAVEQVAVVNNAGQVIDHKGKRADHDRLPEKARLQYQENLAIMNKMRRLRTEIDIKRQQGALPCDIYELLKQLLSLDDKRLKNWADYDAAVPVPPVKDGPATPEAGTAASVSGAASGDVPEVRAADAAKAMGSARTYISRNLALLEELGKDDTKQVLFALKKKTMQARYARLLELGGNVKDETAARLKALGITV